MVSLQFLNDYALAHHITDFIWNYVLNVTIQTQYINILKERMQIHFREKPFVC